MGLKEGSEVHGIFDALKAEICSKIEQAEAADARHSAQLSGASYDDVVSKQIKAEKPTDEQIKAIIASVVTATSGSALRAAVASELYDDLKNP